MAKEDIKLDLTHATLMAVLQVALDSAIKQKTAAGDHLENLSRGLLVPDGHNIRLEDIIAIKEISDPIEKYLKAGDQSIDKIIKIARLLADVMLRRQEEESAELTDEEKQRMQAEIHEMIHRATDNKEDD